MTALDSPRRLRDESFARRAGRPHPAVVLRRRPVEAAAAAARGDERVAHQVAVDDRLAHKGRVAGARVVVVSSDGHKKGTINFDDINLERPGSYKDCSTPFCSAYTQSKLANVLFAKELERRIPPGLNVAVSAVSPGLVNTALFRYSLPDLKADVGTGALVGDRRVRSARGGAGSAGGRRSHPS